MRKEILSELLVLMAILAYNGLFWSEKMGLNTLIFAVIIVGILWYRYPEARHSRTVLIVTAGTLLTALCVVLNNSLFSKVVHILSMLTMGTCWQFPFLRFLWYGLLLGFLNIPWAPIQAVRKWSPLVSGRRNGHLGRWIQISLVPLIIVTVFYVFYYVANEQFAAVSDRMWSAVWSFIALDVSFARLMFFFWGVLFTGALLWRSVLKGMVEADAQKSFDLERSRKKQGNWKPLFSMNGLKAEKRTALLSFGLLNLLILAVNFTDISHVWLFFQPRSASELKNYVHEGTYLLILTILMAMGLIFYFFRKNLNFYPQNKTLKILAYIWLVQNAFMALSVGMRNLHYVSNYALAYKRIGVMLFLALTLYGIWTMYRKIAEKRTAYFILQRNAWAMYLVLTLCCAIDWDIFITKYNLTHRISDGKIDVSFLMYEMSDKNLYLLQKNKALLQDTTFTSYSSVANQLVVKKERFLREQSNYSILSWNWADARNKQHLTE